MSKHSRLKTLSRVRFETFAESVSIHQGRYDVYLAAKTLATKDWTIFLDKNCFRLAAENLRLANQHPKMSNLIPGEYTIADFERVRDWLIGKPVRVRWVHYLRDWNDGFDPVNYWTGTIYEVVA